jgi:hypothetical protein
MENPFVFDLTLINDDIQKPKSTTKSIVAPRKPPPVYSTIDYKHQDIRPTLNYFDLVSIALKHRETGRATLTDICDFLVDEFAYFRIRQDSDSWKVVCFSRKFINSIQITKFYRTRFDTFSLRTISSSRLRRCPTNVDVVQSGCSEDIRILPSSTVVINNNLLLLKEWFDHVGDTTAATLSRLHRTALSAEGIQLAVEAPAKKVRFCCDS